MTSIGSSQEEIKVTYSMKEEHFKSIFIWHHICLETEIDRGQICSMICDKLLISADPVVYF